MTQTKEIYIYISVAEPVFVAIFSGKIEGTKRKHKRKLVIPV
jgi:hypothetical protein